MTADPLGELVHRHPHVFAGADTPAGLGERRSAVALRARKRG